MKKPKTRLTSSSEATKTKNSPGFTLKIPAKDIIQIVITVAVVFTYCWLVIKGVDGTLSGFIVLATYVIKKYLDDIEASRKSDSQS